MALPSEPQTPLSKEQKKILGKLFADERHPVVERPSVPEVPPEVEKVESITGAEVTLPQSISDDQGQVVVDNVAPQKPTITLPLTDEEVEQALHLKVVHSIRWLAEWSQRLLKLTSQKFAYKLTKSSN